MGITPWNYPMLMAAWKAGPSLAAGNVMILKPATVSPLTNLELAKVFEEAGLPKGVLQVVTGPGGEVGDYLAGHQDVDMVAFTGSVEVGKSIMRRAAENVKKIGLELGGKSPNIVFADADFEAAIDGALIAIFAGAGEVCSAGSRLLVERSIHDRFVGELVSRAMAIKVGDPLDAESEMGPLVNKQQLDKVEDYVRIGQEEGATLATGGRRLSGSGFYFEPTIFADVDNSMRIAQEEIFGPVLVVIPFDDEEEAVRIANDTIYGLAGAVWTKDVTRAMRVIKAMRVGIPGSTPTTRRTARPPGRLQAERHRPRAGQLRPRRVHRGQADQHRPHGTAHGRVPARQAGHGLHGRRDERRELGHERIHRRQRARRRGAAQRPPSVP